MSKFRKESRSPEVGGALFLITIGSLFLLSNYGYIELHFWNLILLWPLFLLWPGLTLLLNYISPKTRTMNDLAVSILCLGLFAGALTQPIGFKSTSGSGSLPLPSVASALVAIDHGAGKLYVSPISSSNLYELSYTSEPKISFTEEGSQGNLRIKSTGFMMPFQETLSIGLTTSIPIELSIDSGASSYEIDLSGLRLTSLSLDAGASEGSVSWGSMNPEALESMHFKVGAASLTVSGIGNSGVKNLTFDGGVGSYTFDFSGNYMEEGSVFINAGMSSVSLIIPPDVGARIYLQDVSFPTFSCLEEINSKTYETSNYEVAHGKFDITLAGGLMSADINACP